LLAEGETLHLVTDENKKVKLIPDVYKERLLLGVELEEVHDTFPPNQAPS
jgi:hypothetical protein